jgi:hypothetical protein
MSKVRIGNHSMIRMLLIQLVFAVRVMPVEPEFVYHFLHLILEPQYVMALCQ